MRKKSLSLLIALAMTGSTVIMPVSVLADTQVPGSEPSVSYETHVQNIGWQTPVKDGDLAGTVQKALRMEAFKMSLTGTNLPANASITYKAHIQNIGWQAAVTTPANTDVKVASEAGTDGKALRMEALKISLNNMPGYEVKYQAQVQNIGWQDAVTVTSDTKIDDAAIAGTSGKALRIEAIRISVQKTTAENLAETTALAAVVKAEGSRLQADVDLAKTAVKTVMVKLESDAFTTRINAIKVAMKVSSVSAITSTDVTVTLPAGFDATAAADVNSYAIAVNGEKAVMPTAVVVTGNSAKLSIALAGKIGSLTANGVAGNTTDGTDKFDFQKPTMVNVQALDTKTMIVNFSEKVDSVTGLNPGNYQLYSTQTGNPTAFEASSGVNAAKIQATFAFADTTQKSVKITITNVGNGGGIAGYPMSGLANSNYMLYVSNVTDIATTPNAIVGASNYTFTGTTTPATTAPTLVSSTFNSASGVVTLVFDKGVTGAAPTDDKVYFQVGSSKVLLKNATDYTGVAAGTTVSFTVAAATLANINALGANPQIGLENAAFTDGSNATTAVKLSPTISTAPVLSSVTYNENTNTVVYKFSKTIDVTKITTFANKFKLGGVFIDANSAATFNTIANNTDLSFKLSDADAQAVELLLRGGTLTASVVASTVQDTDTTPNTNVAVSSTATLVAGTTYTKDTIAPTLTGAKYNQDTKVLEFAFNKSIRNTIGDFTAGSVGFYKDDNGVAGLQTTIINGVAADTKIATFADTDLLAATNNHGMLQAGLVADATGVGAATTGSEKSTLYVKDSNGGAEKLQTSIDTAIAASKDVYVDILAGGVKDANTNLTVVDQIAKLTNVAISNAASVTAATTTVVNSNGSITVQFKNGSGPVAVNPSTATNMSNYNVYLTANPLAKAQIEGITMNATNTEATLLLSTPLVASSGYSYTTSGIKTASGAVADIDGTTLLPETFTTGAGPDTVALSATQAVALTDKDNSGTVSAGDTIAITFNEAIKLPTGFDASSIIVSNTHTLGSSAVSLSADKKTLTMTVSSGATIAAGDTLTFPTTIKDYEGNALTAGGTQTSSAMTITGNVASTILSAIYSDSNADGVISTGDILTVKFDQNLKLNTNKVLADLINDITVGTTTFSAATLSGDTLSLTVNAVGTLAIGNTVVVNTTPANVDLVNSWGTKALDGIGKVIVKADATAPTVAGISYKAATHELTLNFSEAVNATGTNANDIAKLLLGKLVLTADAISGGASLGATATAATLSSDKKSITITLSGTESLDAYTTLYITASAFNADVTTVLDGTNEQVLDASGNYAVRAQGTPYTLTIQ